MFISVPIPVLGGAMMLMFGMFNGLVLSNLQVINLNSSRNLAAIGIAILAGVMIPYWVEHFPGDINTGKRCESVAYNYVACCDVT